MADSLNTQSVSENEELPSLLDLADKMSHALAFLEALELAVTSPAINLAQRNPLSMLVADVKRRFEDVEADIQTMFEHERAGKTSVGSQS